MCAGSATRAGPSAPVTMTSTNEPTGRWSGRTTIPSISGASRSGAFLDPLADKVVVLGALFALVAKSIVWWLPVAIIAVREVYITIYRSVVGRKGVSIPARTTAKVKTLFQSVAVALCLVPPLGKHHTVLAVAIWVATILTVFTGGQYY